MPRNLVEIQDNSETFGNIDFTIPKLKTKCCDIEKQWKDPEQYQEFLEQVRGYLSTNNRILIRALSPGCGKTTLCTDIAKGKKYIIITPYNMMRSKLSQAGHTAMTLNKLLAYGKDERHKGTPINLKEYDMIIFDEVYLHDRKARTRITRLMDKEQHLKFLATGDPRQLSAIEGQADIKCSAVQDIQYMFPNRILLKENKRLKDKDEVAVWNQVYEKLFVSGASLEHVINFLTNKGFGKKIMTLKKVKTDFNMAMYNSIKLHIQLETRKQKNLPIE